MKDNTRCKNPVESLLDWYASPLGTLLAETEQAELDNILPNLFGYHLLQVGEGRHNLLSASRILHRVVMSAENCSSSKQVQLQGVPEQLPVFSDSIDSLILYHALEFSPDPHQVLREAERVLVPEGHIVILGFNPRSLWGVNKMLRFRTEEAPWCGRFLSTFRLKDWLALKGFEVTHLRHCFYRPPMQRSGVMNRLAALERWGKKWWSFLGGVYIIVARKKVSTITPIKPRWRPRRSIDPVLGDTATRSYRRDG